MTNSTDKKSKTKRDKPEVDLDAMLDEAESSLLPDHEFQGDEDPIDRLLMDAGFDSDDALMGSELNKNVDVVKDIDLDDLLNGISDDFEEPPSAVGELDEAEPTTEHTTVVTDVADDLFSLDDNFDELNMIQDDPIEAAVMKDLSTSLVAEEPNVNTLEALNDFSDFSDFNEPTIVPAVAVAVEEVDDFFRLDDDFDDFNESDMIQNDPIEAETDAFAESDDFSKLIDEQLAEAEKLSTQANLVAANEEEQAIAASLTDDDDDDDIDRLLMESDFTEEDSQNSTVKKQDELDNDAELSEIDDFFQLDEVSEDFSKQMEDQLAEAEKLSNETSQEDDFLLPDFDITADEESFDSSSDRELTDEEQEDPFADTDFTTENNALPVAEPEAAVINETSASANIENVKSGLSGFEQEDIKKQLEEAKNTVNKTRLLTYVALSFGAIALSAAVGMGVMAYQAKAEISKLSETVSSLEASLAKVAENNPNEEINAMMSSVVQLNQQIYSFITELKGNPQFPVDLLDNKVTDVVAKQDMVSKALAQLQGKLGGLDQKPSLATAVAESPKVDAAHQTAPVKEEKAHEMTPVKAEAEHVQTKEGVTHEPASTKKEVSNEMALIKEKIKQEAAPAKTELKPEAATAKIELKPEIVPVKVKAVPEITAAKIKTQPVAVIAKPATAPKTDFKEEVEKPQKQETDGIWGVNLVAFKQEWFAKSKAAEFARQGVFAEVIPVQGNMYRLRVGGFKSKAEANANKERIKNALNLDSVWVSDK